MRNHPFMRFIKAMMKEFQKLDTPPACKRRKTPVFPRKYKPMTVYHHDGWAICQFLEMAQLQEAFNAVASVIPKEDMKTATVQKYMDWALLEPIKDGSPLMREGYIGWTKVSA